MELVLPTYKISTKSPTDDLRILENLYMEIGSFASTILDKRYLSFSKECMRRLRKITSILERRKDNEAENVTSYVVVNEKVDLYTLAVDELYHLYRHWPERHRKRALEGREQMTFYYEGRIVRELNRRKELSESERLKVDYCKMTYRNELENMSFLFSIPVESQSKLIAPEENEVLSSCELETLIRRHSKYRGIEERELLIEYIDIALDLMQSAENKAMMIGLAAEIVELGRREVARVPEWTIGFLTEGIDEARKDSRVSEEELVIPLLTLSIRIRSTKLEREAQRIINRCYRSAFDDSLDLSKRIESLHTAVTCSDYVTRFSIRKAASLWNEFTRQAHSSSNKITSKEISLLSEIAHECECYSPV